jgi:hypothetical protein
MWLQIKPASVMSAQLVAFGTSTSAVHGPEESTRDIMVPDMAIVPAAGDWYRTTPAGTSLLQLVVVLQTKPAASTEAQLVAAGTFTS